MIYLPSYNKNADNNNVKVFLEKNRTAVQKFDEKIFWKEKRLVSPRGAGQTVLIGINYSKIFYEKIIL